MSTKSKKKPNTKNQVKKLKTERDFWKNKYKALSEACKTSIRPIESILGSEEYFSLVIDD